MAVGAAAPYGTAPPVVGSVSGGGGALGSALGGDARRRDTPLAGGYGLQQEFVPTGISVNGIFMIRRIGQSPGGLCRWGRRGIREARTMRIRRRRGRTWSISRSFGIGTRFGVKRNRISGWSGEAVVSGLWLVTSGEERERARSSDGKRKGEEEKQWLVVSDQWSVNRCESVVDSGEGAESKRREEGRKSGREKQ